MKRRTFNRHIERNFDYLKRVAKRDTDSLGEMVASVGQGGFKSFSFGGGQASVRTWMTRCLYYTMVNRRRKAARDANYLDYMTDVEPIAPDTYEAIDLKVSIEKKLRRSHAMAWHIFVLLYVGGYTLREIERIKGVPRSTVHGIIARHIRPALREVLDDYAT